jgi:50S ribosome-binding GTPase
MTTPSWLDVLDKVIGACTAHGHPELTHRLRRTRARLLDPTLRVLVVGEPNHGKSQLVNALVNAPVCAVDDDVSTTVPTVVRHAEVASAVLVGASRRIQVPIERLGERLSGTPGEELVAAEVGIPRALLSRGLELVDSPPTIGAGQIRAAEDAAKDSDVVVLATEATSELSATELDLLGRMSGHCPQVVVVLTKIDLVPRWRRVAQRNLALLGEYGVPAAVVPVSAALRLYAAQTGDRALNAESGFTDLVERLQQLMANKPNVLAPRAAALAARAAVEELLTGLSGSSGGQDQDTPRPLGGLDELRRGATRSQTILADEVADLVADLDYDLRDRARRILREIDKAFETADPLVQWPAFAEWLEARLVDAADANFGWLVERCHWIADKVAQSFPHPCQIPPECVPAGYQDPFDEVGPLDKPHLERFTLSQKAFTGLRGSYGGVLMFGLLTSLTVGLPLINPIALGAGVLFGGKSILEEGETRLRRRQAAAKTAAQRHVDDFFLRFGKDCKDVLRYVHRGLRDHFAGLASELQDEMTERDRRALERRRELEQLAALCGAARSTTMPEITA